MGKSRKERFKAHMTTMHEFTVPKNGRGITTHILSYNEKKMDFDIREWIKAKPKRRRSPHYKEIRFDKSGNPIKRNT